MLDLANVPLEPAIQLNGERTLRTAADAAALLREHELRPGVDDRDEVLHQIERAKNGAEMQAALMRFRQWLVDWGTSIPVTDKPGSSRGLE